jgi:hypothetical protein
MKVAILPAMIVVMNLSIVITTSADDRGTLRGRFVYDGEPPKPKMVKISKDADVFGDEILDEFLLVHPENRGIANVVVSLHAKDPPAHPRLREILSARVPMVIERGRFEPHILVLTAGQTILFMNNDPVEHTPKLDVHKNHPIDGFMRPRSSLQFSMTNPELIPSIVSNARYRWMRGYMVVASHPYVAVSNSEGKFQIPELPPGEWTFRVWHEQAGYIQKVTRDENVEEWPKGRFTIQIASNKDSNLGEILIPAELFAK